MAISDPLEKEALEQLPEGLASACLMLAEVVEKNTELIVRVDNTGTNQDIQIEFKGHARIKDREKFDFVTVSALYQHEGEWLITNFYPEKIRYV